MWRRLSIIEDAMMLLNFDIEVFLSKDILVPACHLVCFLYILFEQHFRYLTRKTRRGHNQAFAVLFQHTLIHTWSQVPPLSIGNGGQLHEVVVPRVILCQQQQVMVVITEAFGVVIHILSQICLNTDNRVNSSRLTRLVKFYSSIHCTMIGDRQMTHPQSL